MVDNNPNSVEMESDKVGPTEVDQKAQLPELVDGVTAATDGKVEEDVIITTNLVALQESNATDVDGSLNSDDAAATETPAGVEEASNNEEFADTDDFGDFADANEIENLDGAEQDIQPIHQTTATTPPEAAMAVSEVEDVDFGEFSEPNGTFNDTSEPDTPAAEDADFGDFEDAPTPDRSEVDVVLESNSILPVLSDADHQHDSDVVESCELETTQDTVDPTPTSVTPDVPSLDDQDDDFGDFDDASSPEPVDVKASTAAEAIPNAGHQGDGEPNNNGDDDDFGDFGDFSSFQEPEGEPAIIESKNDDAPDPFILEIQSVIENSRRVLGDVFGKFLNDDEEKSVETSDASPDFEVVTVNTVMESVPVFQCNESQWTARALLDLLTDSPALKKSSPRLLVTSECRDMNAHFIFPATRSSSRGNKLTYETTANSSSSRPYVPDVLPIQLPTGVETPRSTTTEKTVLSLDSERFSSQGGMAGLPPPPLTLATDKTDPTKDDDEFADFQSSDEIIEKVYNISLSNESDAKTNGPSATAQKLLDQIPDLSFMLKPTLSLPTQT